MENTYAKDSDVPDCNTCHSCCDFGKGGRPGAHRMGNCPFLIESMVIIGRWNRIEANTEYATEVCHNCGVEPSDKLAHDTSWCPFPPKGQECAGCCAWWHFLKECPNPRDQPEARWYVCRHCGQSGGTNDAHWTGSCPTKISPDKKTQTPRALWNQEDPQFLEEQQTNQPPVGEEYNNEKTPEKTNVTEEVATFSYPKRGYECHECGELGGDPDFSHWIENCPMRKRRSENINKFKQMTRDDRAVKTGGLCQYCGEKATNAHLPWRCSKRQ